MCKCGKETAIKKTGECMKCYGRRKYLESVGRTELWRGNNGISKYKYMNRAKLRAEIDTMKALLCTLAKDVCERCEELDCSDCWAIEYSEEKLPSYDFTPKDTFVADCKLCSNCGKAFSGVVCGNCGTYLIGGTPPDILK